MKNVQSLDSGIEMGNMQMNNIRYADDTALVEMVYEKLQISTNALEDACHKWSMKINPKKCKVMSDDTRNIALDSTPIDNVNSFVFLGRNVPTVNDSRGRCQTSNGVD